MGLSLFATAVIACTYETLKSPRWMPERTITPLWLHARALHVATPPPLLPIAGGEISDIVDLARDPEGEEEVASPRLRLLAVLLLVQCLSSCFLNL